MDSILYHFFLAMKVEIERHKWYESEKVGHDVGYEFAMIDWFIKHKSEWKKHYMQTLHATSSLQKPA